jgi:rod shape-determining protein MreD
MQPNGILAAVIPTLSVVPFALVSIMPLHAPYWAAFALPLVPLAAIYNWARHRPDLLPAPIVLLFGLFVDLVTDGPLGYWAALYILTYAFATERNRHEEDRTFVVMVEFLRVLMVVTAAGWVVASLYFWRLFDPVPFAVAIVLGAVIWPIVDYFLGPIVRWLTLDRTAPAILRQGG